MSSPASRWIDARLSDALARVFEQFDGHIRAGYCTEADVTDALNMGWGDEIADGWREWLEEGAE